MRRRSQSLSERKKKPSTPQKKKKKLPGSQKKKLPAPQQLKRRHSDTEIHLRLRRNDSHARAKFKCAAMTMCAVTRLRNLSLNSDKAATERPTPRRRCGSFFCDYELLSCPLVVRRFFSLSGCLSINRPIVTPAQISLAACSAKGRTFEDSRRMGKGVTVVRVLPCLQANRSCG